MKWKGKKGRIQEGPKNRRKEKVETEKEDICGADKSMKRGQRK